MKLYIKNMVCPRCIKAVEKVMENVNAQLIYLHLGELLLQNPLSQEQLESVSL